MEYIQRHSIKMDAYWQISARLFGGRRVRTGDLSPPRPAFALLLALRHLPFLGRTCPQYRLEALIYYDARYAGSI